MPAANDRAAMRVAVVGLGAILPGAVDVRKAWEMIITGRDEITEVPPDQWLVDDYFDANPTAPDKVYARQGAFLPEVDFDPMAFGIPPTSIEATDTAQLLSLMVAEQVLQDAGGVDSVDRERVSVILGATAYLPLVGHMAARVARPQWLAGLREAGIPESQAQAICDRISAQFVSWQEDTFPGLLPNVTAGRIANRFDLHGTNHTTDAACASSLAAVCTAIDELTVGRADLCIAGGFDTVSDAMSFFCFSKTPALSRSGDCRPFSAQADGTMLGQGVVMVALKRLADAERDGDEIYAVLTGVGTASDGRGSAIYAPLPQGQERALRRAYEAAGYGPETVELVEAHGTGTKAGDRAEFTALNAVFAEPARAGDQWCALGSIKSQIGHAKGAAGAAGLLKAVLAVHHRTLPPTIKVDQPNPDLSIETSPFYLNTVPRPWVHAPGSRRRASVSSFGFGGSNFHVTLEEYLPSGRGRRPRRIRTCPAELILLSADTLEQLKDRLRAPEQEPLEVIARRSQQAFDPKAAHRLAAVAASSSQLAALLQQAAAAVPDGRLPSGVHYAAGPPASGGVAILYPGQGAQYPGMGADVAMHVPAAARVWDKLACASFEGEALHRLVFPPPAFSDAERKQQQARLMATEWAQPALAVHALALTAALTELGVTPDCVAGHSFGELIALQVAGAWDACSLIALARRRGELMRAAAAGTPSGMLAVAASRSGAERHLAESGLEQLWIANANAPDQTVVSGTSENLTRLADHLAAAGVIATPLAAAAAFHTPLVAEAALPFARYLADVDTRPLTVTVYGNADAGVYPAGPDEVIGRAGAHLASAVLFTEQIEAMYAAGVRTFIEAGPAGALTGLVGRILEGRPHIAIALDRADRNGMTVLYEGLGRLAVSGVALDWSSHWADYDHSEDSVPPRRDPKITVRINGGNYGRPYPPAAGVPPAPDPDRIAPPARQPTGDELMTHHEQLRDDVQRRAAEAHAEYQRLMTEAHLAFLRLSQEALYEQQVLDRESVPLSMPALPGQAPALSPGPEQNAAAAPAPLPHTAISPSVLAALNASSPPQGVNPPSPRPAAPTAGRDMTQVVLSVVSDRTGFPVEALEPSMDLESDLGIDSIKRVDVLTALRQELGDVQIQASELWSLRTLQQVIDRLGVHADATVPAPGSAGSEPDDGEPVRDGTGVVRLIIEPVFAPAVGLSMPGLRRTEVVVADDGSGLAETVAAQLMRHSVAAVAVPSASDVPDDADAVLLLGGLAPDLPPEAAIALQRTTFQTARRLARRFRVHGGIFVTVQDTGGDFGLSGTAGDRAWSGGLAALARTAAKEWPAAAVKAIDCERRGRTGEQIAAAVVAELLSGGPMLDVGLRADGARITPQARPAAPDAGPRTRIDKESVLVVTGGAGGITAASVTALAARVGGPRVALLGRTVLSEEPEGLPADADEATLTRALAGRNRSASPAKVAEQARRILAVRAIRAALAALHAAGSPARYLSVDVTNPGAVQASLEKIRAEWGPITGIVHAAGQLTDKLMQDKTDEQFDRVFATKAAGLQALLAATAKDPLDTLCVFSSIAGCYGNAGQADYAMGNEVIAQVASAEATCRPGCDVMSIAWGPWQGGMVTPALAAKFAERGVPTIGIDEGSAAFADQILSGPNGLILIAAADGTLSPADALSRSGELPPAEVVVTASTYPQLADHAIAGSPVLPLAQVLEWFTGAVRSWRPLNRTVSLRDVRVQRKATLPELARAGHHFTIRGRRADGQCLLVELVGEDGHAHVRATADLAPAQLDCLPEPQGLTPLPGTDPYDGSTLFHGPSFQALATVEGVSIEGTKGTVADLTSLNWPDRHWQTDPAALDGALQLAVLWAQEALGEATLPMAIGKFRVYEIGPLTGAVRCIVRSAPAEADFARCHITLTCGSGRTAAEIRDLELIRRPS